MKAPLANGANGSDRDPLSGKFLPGNKGGPGAAAHRQTQKMAQLRAAALAAVSAQDLRAVMRGLIEAARGGDAAAARLLLIYAIGRPSDVDLDRVLAPSPIVVGDARELTSADITRALEQAWHRYRVGLTGSAGAHTEIAFLLGC